MIQILATLHTHANKCTIASSFRAGDVVVFAFIQKLAFGLGIFVGDRFKYGVHFFLVWGVVRVGLVFGLVLVVFFGNLASCLNFDRPHSFVLAWKTACGTCVHNMYIYVCI